MSISSSVGRWAIANYRRRLGVPVLLLFVMTASAFIVASPANADTASAMRRCINGERPQVDASAILAGTSSTGTSIPSGSNPPNILQPGDVFSISATGAIRNDLWNHWWGPGGDGYPAPASFPFPGISEFSDVVAPNNNPGGWVGDPHVVTEFAGCNTWDSSFAVRFLFYVNDSAFWDNDGSLTNNVKIWRASAP
jgi:hypothetical protein